MGVASLVAVVVGFLAVVVLFLGVFMPAGAMSTDQHDCGPESGPCTQVSKQITWRLQHERLQVTTLEYEDAAAHAAQQPEAPAQRDAFTTSWGSHRSDAAGAMATAGVLGWVAVGTVLLGAVLVLVGRFTHMSVGITGGAISILSVLVVAALVMQAWTGVQDLGEEVRQSLKDAEAASKSADRPFVWATSGPFFGAGLITLLAGALLALVAGIVGVVPAGYRD